MSIIVSIICLSSSGLAEDDYGGHFESLAHTCVVYILLQLNVTDRDFTQATHTEEPSSWNPSKSLSKPSCLWGKHTDYCIQLSSPGSFPFCPRESAMSVTYCSNFSVSLKLLFSCWSQSIRAVSLLMVHAGLCLDNRSWTLWKGSHHGVYLSQSRCTPLNLLLDRQMIFGGAERGQINVHIMREQSRAVEH